MLLNQFSQHVRGALYRASDRPTLDATAQNLVIAPKTAYKLRALRALGISRKREKEVPLAGKNILHAGEALRGHERRSDAIVRCHARVERLLDVLHVAVDSGKAGRLLCCV
jgi:hypothetical protein